jgi:hypothetical protein
MIRSLFARLFGGWPADLPRYYPDIDELQLAQFLSEDEYRRIKSFENVYILPLISRDGPDAEVCFGLGLAHLLIRNLMLLRDVSIHGPEDTAGVPFETAESVIRDKPQSSYVTGVAGLSGQRFTLRAEIHRPGRPKTTTTVDEADFRSFLRKCSTSIGEALGSSLQTTVKDAWEVGQPRDADSLIRCGALQFNYDRHEAKEKAAAAKPALAADPDFVVPVWQIDGELPEARSIYLQALQRDPYNAQLCFTTFCAVWKSQHPQPEAVQFCRKAIELSPGHGKAHMCAPHSAPPNADMIFHSELGYRLLPGNTFAVNNYVIYLEQHGAPVNKLIELAAEGIAADPADPGNYMRMIELYASTGDRARP